MSADVWSLLGGWWARLFGRAGRSHGSEAAKVSVGKVEEGPPGMSQGGRPLAADELGRSEVHSPTLGATKGVVAPSREAMQQALAETLGAEGLEREMPELDAAGTAALRSRTLDELKHLQQIPALQSFTRELLSTLGRVDVDVADVVERVKTLVASGHVNLVETLAERIADLCLGDRRVQEAWVRLEKLHAIAEAGGVGCEVTKRRS